MMSSPPHTHHVWACMHPPLPPPTPPYPMHTLFVPACCPWHQESGPNSGLNGSSDDSSTAFFLRRRPRLNSSWSSRRMGALALPRRPPCAAAHTDERTAESSKPGQAKLGRGNTLGLTMVLVLVLVLVPHLPIYHVSM